MRVGIVGCGYWGRNLVRNLIETNRAESVYCFDANPTTLRNLHYRFPSVKLAESLERLLDDCDAIMVSTPVAAHHSVAKAALVRGKSVFVEKPLARSSQESEELISLADSAGCTLMVGHTFVYSPPVRKVKEYIDGDVLGEIFFLSSSRVNFGIHRPDVDVIWDLAPHDLSMFHFWLGEGPSRVSATGRACVGRLLDVAYLRLEYPSGAVANLEMSWLAPRKLRRTVVVGKKSMVLYDDTAVDKITLYDRGVLHDAPDSFGEYQLSYRSGDVVSPNLEATEPLLTQAHHFLDCVENGARPATDGKMGLEIVHVLEAASHSLRCNGEFVLVERSDAQPHPCATIADAGLKRVV